jgi:6-phosphogluconolactonase
MPSDPETQRRRNDMPDVLYVGLQDGDKIVSFGIDAGGKLAPRAETPAAGAPSAFAVSPDRRVLYVGYRGTPGIESWRIDGASGALTSMGRVATEHPPTYLAPDRAGKYLLSAYYQGGYAAVHALASDGAVSGPALDRQNTAAGAHAILTDPSNRFAFVPHIARQNDNVLEPPRNIPGPNFIAQFRFDAATGRLSPNTPFKLEPREPIGPRNYCFHPTLDVAYFSDEQGCSVTAYRLDRASGTLSAVETTPSLPSGVTVRNTCSQIYLTPSARFLYVGNRGHNSIAGFTVDPATGRLTPAGHAATEAVPTAFGLDSTGTFLFAAGTASGRLAAYRVDGGSGALTPLETHTLGGRPAAVLAVPLGR